MRYCGIGNDQKAFGKFRFIDLFAGLGGFHVALSRLGGVCVLASEWKTHLSELYHYNHGLKPFGDVSKIDVNSIPTHDVLAAGFPCQPFSKAGEQLGFSCTKQGALFFDVVKILSIKKPKYFILENVPNLLHHNEGKTWREIQEQLNGLGYNILAEKLSPHHFGIPQTRERVYIVGSTQSLESFRWPEACHGPTSIESVLDKFPLDAKPLSSQVIECIDVWDEFIKLLPKNCELPSFPLWSMEWGASYPFENETPHARVLSLGEKGLLGFCGSHGRALGRLRGLEARWNALPSHARTEQLQFPEWKKNYIRQNRQFYSKHKEVIDGWKAKILKFPSSLQKLEWNAKGGEKNIWSYVLQFRASGLRVKKRNKAPGLVAMTDTQVPIIGWERRYMTPKECARLQSLDVLSKLPDSPIKAFEALGNAVNAQVVELIASSLISCDE
ncbi:DNA (cytosine-5-)-methyltransferase [Massilia sp. METH4]|uniref:DNA cytosine methyltransferase n=1 Tax=Massilia sp. METH4 TaxID=3123041 RepID=UPI0030CEE633